jgi:hypothetical protein
MAVAMAGRINAAVAAAFHHNALRRKCRRPVLMTDGA